ncbi:MAG: TPM domain-containing protein [Bacteroidetes bacterium]|nr:TPM domain-containing protein [Bacteroidota bacterium]
MKKTLLFLSFIFVGLALKAQDTMPKPATKINDKSGLLKTEEITTLQTAIDNFATNRKGNAYILILDSLPKGQNILAYSKGIFKKWELNNSGVGLNFIIIYSRKEHAVRIEASDKVIALVTKDYLQNVTNKSMIPYFQKKQDYAAIKRGLEMVILKIENNE